MTIFLIGFMACGKTSVGRVLAKTLNFDFFDIDKEIEKLTGKTIGVLFSLIGEKEFRVMEHVMLEKYSNLKNVVISTGGGAPCFHNNIKLMNEKGKTIYISLTAKSLVKRLLSISPSERAKRPLIANKSDVELYNYVTTTLEKRNDFYLQAKIILNADNLNTKTIVNEIITHHLNPQE